MVDRETFDLIKKKHGSYASWAVWGEQTEGPKSGMGDMDVLDPDKNPSLLATLRNDVVMLGLNLSKFVPEHPFGNFHPQYLTAQDYKTRYAFIGTPYYGAYMTDVVKGVVEMQSGNVMRALATNPTAIRPSIDLLLGEFDDLHASSPTLIAFGGDAYTLASQHVPRERYSQLVRVTHYSHYISKEAYRERVFAELGLTQELTSAP